MWESEPSSKFNKMFYTRAIFLDNIIDFEMTQIFNMVRNFRARTISCEGKLAVNSAEMVRTAGFIHDILEVFDVLLLIE